MEKIPEGVPIVSAEDAEDNDDQGGEAPTDDILEELARITEAAG